MNTENMVSSDEARQGLDQLIEQITGSHSPVTIMGRHHNAVLVAADDWRAIEETLYLHQFPGLVDSIREAAVESDEEGMRLEDLDW